MEVLPWLRNFLLFPDLYIKYLAECNAVKLFKSECWTAKPYGHRNILEKVPRELREFPMGYATTNPNFTRNFNVEFRTRTRWKTDGLLQGYDSVFGLWKGILHRLSVSKSYCPSRFAEAEKTGETGSLSVAGSNPQV